VIGILAKNPSWLGIRWLLTWTLAATMALAAGAGVAVWWYHTTRPEYRLRRGQEALRQGRPDKAERLAERLEAAGYADHARLLRGEALLREHRLAAAAAEFNQIQDRGELLVEAAAIYGLAFLSVQRSWEAERLLRFVVSRQPDHLEAQRGLAAIYFDQGALQLAVQHAKECARLEPHRGCPYRFLGVIFKDLGQYAEAQAAFRQALERELPAEQVNEVKEGLIEVLVWQKEYAEALAMLDERPSSVSASPKMMAARAECLWGLDRGAEAKVLLDSELTEHRDSVEILRLRAKLHLSENEPQKAAVLLERALHLDRHDHLSRYQLVQAYQMLGRAREAAEQQRLLEQTQGYLAELTKLNAEIAERPWDAAVRARMAEICDKLDKPEMAAMWRQAAAASRSQGDAASRSQGHPGNERRSPRLQEPEALYLRP
jgi:tetratricopeptide (TPR) repeat protein